MKKKEILVVLVLLVLAFGTVFIFKRPKSAPTSQMFVGISSQNALKLANDVFYSRCDRSFDDIQKKDWPLEFLGAEFLKTACPGFVNYQYDQVWLARMVLVSEAPVCTPDMPGSCTKGKFIIGAVLVGLEGKLTCVYAQDLHSDPGILFLEKDCEVKPIQL